MLFRWIWHLFNSLQKEVAAAIVAGATTIIVSVLSINFARFYERKRIIEQELREKKIPMYNEFVEFWFKILMSDKIKDKKLSESDMMNFFIQFTQELMVWGSDEVLRSWSHYRRLYVDNQLEIDSFKAMLEFEKLLFAIRKDTGHKNKGVKQGDLLGLFVNDIHNYLG